MYGHRLYNTPLLQYSNTPENRLNFYLITDNKKLLRFQSITEEDSGQVL